MKVLITGSNGFIGQHLCQTLESRYSIIRHGRKVEFSNENNKYFNLDVNSNSDWQGHLENINTVIHLAASAHKKLNDLEKIDEVNVNGTLRLAQQAATAGVKRFIFISSIGVLGDKTILPFNERTIEAPHSDYAKSKLKAEIGLLELARASSLEVVIIRPVLVYGGTAPGNFSKLKSLINKLPILPFGLVNNKRSFISVDNLVDFIRLCVEHPNAKNEIFCISDGVDVSIKKFTSSIATGLSKNLIQIPVPTWFIKFIGSVFRKDEMVKQLIGDLQIDISKAKNLLGWSPVETMDQAMSKLK